MENSRLVTLVKKLSIGTLRRFQRYVGSSYVQQNPKLLHLVEHLIRIAPDFSASLLEKEVLFQVMFGKKTAFKEQKVHDQLSALLRLLEQFLAIEQVVADPFTMNFHLLEALQKYDISDHFERTYRKTISQEDKQPLRNSKYYLRAYRLDELGDSFRGRRSTRGFVENLAEMDVHLDSFYFSSKLRLACEIQNRRQLHNADYQQGIMDEVIQWLGGVGKSYLETPAIAIYFQIYQMFAGANPEENYHALVHLLGKHSTVFSKEEAYGMYTYALNYCTRQINKGDADYLAEIFSLYSQLLDTGILLEQGILPHSHYKNITTVGLRLKKFDWVREFLDAYKLKLHPDYQVNAYNYNLSIYYYEQRRFQEAMRLLQQVEFTDVFYQLSARCTLMKIYYELTDWDGLKYLSQAFLAFLKRNKQIPSYHIQSHTHFIRFIKKAARLRQQANQLTVEERRERIKVILGQMQEAGGIIQRRWITGKLEGLGEDVVYAS